MSKTMTTGDEVVSELTAVETDAACDALIAALLRDQPHPMLRARTTKEFVSPGSVFVPGAAHGKSPVRDRGRYSFTPGKDRGRYR